MRAFNHPYGVGYILGQVEVSEDEMALLSDLYDAELGALDAELGTLLDGLDAAGILDDTVVVITSDHGEHLGEHGLMDHKFSLHRTLTRVPLLVRYPDRFDCGRVVEQPVRLEDVMPTVLELAGVAVPDGLDGESLTGGLDGRLVYGAWGVWARAVPEAKEWFPDAEFSLFHTSLRSVYDGRYHYIRDSRGNQELYDLARDPDELHNLAEAEPETVRRMRALLAEGERGSD